jgi:hypothetical protein
MPFPDAAHENCAIVGGHFRPDITPVPFLAKTRQEKQTKNKKNKMHRDLSTSARKMKQKRTNKFEMHDG